MVHETRILLCISTFTTALRAPIAVLLALCGFVLSLTAMTEFHITPPTLHGAGAFGEDGKKNARLLIVAHPPHSLNAGGRCWAEVRVAREYQQSITAAGLPCPSLAASRRSQQPAGMTYPLRLDPRKYLMQMTIAQRWYRQVRSPDLPNSGLR